MQFKEFKEQLVDWMNTRYEGITFSAHDIVKNNGLHLTGICGHSPESNVSPQIYINDLYDSVMSGEMTFGAAATVLEKRYEMACKEQIFAKPIDLLSFDAVKDNLVARIINRKLNEELLADVPHKVLADDLAITYRYVQAKDECGIASALIHNKEFETWNISIDQLHKLALANTERIFPAEIDSLGNVVKKCFMGSLPEDLSDLLEDDFDMMNAQIQMYVVTNDAGINGATAILYPSVQQYISEKLGENVYILPSSIHECMVTVAGSEEEGFLKNLVNEANQTAVGLQDYLSDSIYRIKDGELENVNEFEKQIDQALEDALNELPEEDLGMEP